MIKIKEVIKELTKETLEGSSIHALPNIVRNKSIAIKIIWTVCFLISFSFCCWSIIGSIRDYLSYDVVTNIKVTYENKLKFPIITICNLNYFATDYSFLVAKFLFNTSKSFDEMGGFTKALSNYYIQNYGLDKTKLGYELNETIINCYFMWQQCNMTNDFEQYFDPWYGKCFRFNSGKNMLGESVDQKYVYQSGILGSLDLQIFIGSSASTNNKPFTTENGFIIFVNDEIIETVSFKGIRIAAGTLMSISLDKYLVRQKPKPYSECTDDLNQFNSYDSEFYRNSFKLYTKYHFTNCLSLCMQKLIGKECGCQSSYNELTYYPNMKLCGIPNGNQTIKETTEDYYCGIITVIKFAGMTNDERDCDCPLECEQANYVYSISWSEFPTFQYYSNYLNKSTYLNSKSMTSYNDVKQSVARVQIFFDDMKQTVIKEYEKMSMFGLVSNIGGLLGLFLGN